MLINAFWVLGEEILSLLNSQHHLVPLAGPVVDESVFNNNSRN